MCGEPQGFIRFFKGNVYWKTLCVMVKNGKRHVQIVVSRNFIQLFHATNPTISKQLSLHFPGCTGSKAPGHVRWPQRPSNISRIAPLTNVFSSTKIFFLSKFQIPRAVGRIGRINIYQILSYTIIYYHIPSKTIIYYQILSDTLSYILSYTIIYYQILSYTIVYTIIYTIIYTIYDHISSTIISTYILSYTILSIIYYHISIYTIIFTIMTIILTIIYYHMLSYVLSYILSYILSYVLSITFIYYHLLSYLLSYIISYLTNYHDASFMLQIMDSNHPGHPPKALTRSM